MFKLPTSLTLVLAFLCFLLSLSTAGGATGEKTSDAEGSRWAVLVAGSAGYYNYRHQSDTCHAYKILIDAGVHPDRIIHMAFDDMADHTLNPLPGTLFNRPTGNGQAGQNVYDGCRIDYRGRNVTADKFLAVLRGDKKTAGGKVLRSGPKDTVFVFYSDHGATGLVAMPSGPSVTARDLNEALQQMHSRKMYRKLVFYLEACESGSMFSGILPNNVEIYATTAANPEESSWGTYCPPDDMVNGTAIGSCLGDEYSVNWMENTETEGMCQTLEQQFEIVRDRTKMSHVSRYGSESFWDDPIGAFLSDRKRKATQTVAQETGSNQKSAVGRINSRDIPMNDAFWRYLRATGDQERMEAAAELVKQINHRVKEDLKYSRVARFLNHPQDMHELLKGRVHPRTLLSECFDAVVKIVETKCGGFSDYSLRYSKLLAYFCQEHRMEDVAQTLLAVCETA